MKPAPLFAVLVALQGCVGPGLLTPSLPMRSEPVIEGTQFEADIRVSGVERPIQGAVLSYYYIRSWVNRQTREVTHQLYVSHYYHGDWIFWNRANDQEATPLEFTQISREVGTCSSYSESCSFTEVFGADLSDQALRIHRAGYAVKFYSSTGHQMVIVLDSVQIARQLEAVQRVGGVSPSGQPTVSAPSPVNWAPDRLTMGSSVFRLVIRGDSVASVRDSWARTTRSGRPVLRLISRTEGGAIWYEDTVTVDTATLAVVQFRQSGVWEGGRPVWISVDYEGSHVHGHVTVPGKDADVDTTVAPNMLNNLALEAVLPALPLTSGGSWTLIAYDVAGGESRAVKVSVKGQETVTVPAGSFACWKVATIDEKGPSTYYVTEARPYLVVKWSPDTSADAYELLKRPVEPTIAVPVSPGRLVRERLWPAAFVFRLMAQGTQVGQLRRAVERARLDGRQVLRVTTSTRIAGQAIQLDDTTTVDAATRQPISERRVGNWGEQAVQVTLNYDRTHLRGHVRTPTAQGLRDVDVDTTLSAGALGYSVESLLIGLPLIVGGRWTQTAYDPIGGSMQTTVLTVMGEETITVPAGTFPCWEVTVTQGEVTATYYVTKGPPYVVAKYVLGDPAVSFELVEQARR